mgnify:CR=1 FL=1
MVKHEWRMFGGSAADSLTKKLVEVEDEGWEVFAIQTYSYGGFAITGRRPRPEAVPA